MDSMMKNLTPTATLLRFFLFVHVRYSKWQNNVAVLDTERWHWRHPTTDGPNPAPRSYHSATVVGSLMVVFGGNNQDESFDKVNVLDTSASYLIYSSLVCVCVCVLSRELLGRERYFKILRDPHVCCPMDWLSNASFASC